MGVKKIKILFIVNPISGVQKKNHLPDLILKYIDDNQFDTTIEETQYAGHATQLAQKAILKFQKIVAVGGDGTINEVIQGIVGSSVPMGIIPMGSGNGLARHLKIAMKCKKAIQQINNYQIKPIDICCLNQSYFTCTAGIGFDALIGYVFSKQSKRGFRTYLSTTIREFKHYKASTYDIIIDGQPHSFDAFSITIANSSQFGNNAMISPTSSMQDGLFELVIIKPFPKYSFLMLGLRLFTGFIHRSKYVETIKANNVTFKITSPTHLHLDGEPQLIDKDVSIKIEHKKLQVSIPKKVKDI